MHACKNQTAHRNESDIRPHIGPDWNSEVMVTNSRFFGHALAAIRLEGGVHTLISNNVIGDSSIRASGSRSGIEVGGGCVVCIFSWSGVCGLCVVHRVVF